MIHELPRGVHMTLKKNPERQEQIGGRKGLDGGLTGIYDPWCFAQQERRTLPNAYKLPSGLSGGNVL